jgi:hypothetical protein
MPNSRVRVGSAPAVQPVWIGVGVPPDFRGLNFLWVKGFVGKTR